MIRINNIRMSDIDVSGIRLGQEYCTRPPVFDPAKLTYQAIWTVNGKTNQDIDKNIPNLIDATNPLLCYNFAWGGNSGYTENGLSFDGVNDSITSELSLPVLNKYTVIGDFHITNIRNSGISKGNNWYIYRDYVYINSTSLPFDVRNAFAISSSGLILTEDNHYLSDKIGVGFNKSKISSINNPTMIFRSLAIISDELDENQIRETLEYLKTLKANNIG